MNCGDREYVDIYDFNQSEVTAIYNENYLFSIPNEVSGTHYSH